eukprot:XP_019930004.1 PREDICTED: uncharacterized protein LOC105346079 isoform X1 [Crassostrea gigas]
MPKSIQDMAQLADQYREARMTNAVNLIRVKANGFQPPTVNHPGNPSDSSGEKSNQNSRKPFVPKSDRRCYKCNRMGHIASECKPKPNVNAVTTQEPWDYQETSLVGAELPAQVSFVTTIPIKTDINLLQFDSPTAVSSSHCRQQKHNMPSSTGYVEGEPVTVLRDTGCSGIVVRTSKVNKGNMIKDKFQTCILADGSSIRVPVASIFIDTPYITETFEACCMGKPVYDLIIGNVGKVRPPGDPDTQWSETHAAEIRMQAEAKLKPRSQFKVPKISSKNITPKNKKVKQQTGDSLQKLCHVSTSGQEEDYKIDVKGKSKAFHVNMVTKYIDRNADPPNLNQDDEATVSSAVIDRPEDEDVEKYGLQSVEDKEELSRVDIIQELGPEDRQKIVGKDQLKAQSDKEKTIDKQTTNYDFIDIFYGPLKFAINEFFCNVNMLFIG